MLSKKFKTEIKQTAIKTTLAISTVAVLFGVGMNLDSIVNTVREQIEKIQGDQILTESEVFVQKNSTGYSLDIAAKDDSGVRKIEVYQESTKIEEKNFDGSDEVENSNVYLNNIPFGQTQTITVKVNGKTIDTREITNTRYIATAQDMVAFRMMVKGGNGFTGQIVELTNDIDLSTVCSAELGNWVPIGTFYGTFNGNYHKIENLYINSTSSSLGLFSVITNATVKNLTVSGNINSSNGSYIGGISAVVRNSRIINCKNEINITSGGNNIGGISGTCENTSVIAYCCNVATVTGGIGVAGISGILATASSSSNSSLIINSYNTGNVTATTKDGNGVSSVGGIVGLNFKNNRIFVTYNTGTIRAYGRRSGGIVGCNENSAQTFYAYNKGTVIYNNGSVASSDIGGDSGGRIAGLNYNASVSNYSGTSIANYSSLNSYSSNYGYDKNCWVEDKYGINNGNPILRWQVECAELNVSHEYMHVGNTKQLILDTSTLPYTNEYITWHSYDESIATIDNNGLLTCVGEGYTTVWAEYSSKYNIKVMAVINVAKKGATTYAQSSTGLLVNDNGFTAVLKEDGTVWTSGSNTDGQLGNGNNINSIEPVQVMIDPNTPLTNVVKIATSHASCFAVTKEGFLYSWGMNNYGQLGTNDTNNKNFATRVVGVNGSGCLEEIVDVYSHQYYA